VVARPWNSPDFIGFDAPGVNKAQVCIREDQCDMCNPPRALAGLGEVLGGLRSLIASAKGGGERAGGHRGLRAADKAVQRGRR
jgi:hypothetical protein